MAYPVECVVTDDSSEYNDCRSIITIGIPSKSGGVNTYTPEEIYNRIVQDDEEFVVKHEGSRTSLVPVEDGETKYVRTEPNDTKEDNLLKQPNC